MKQFTRCVSIVLVAVMILGVPVSAAGVSRASNFFMTTSTYIEKGSGTSFDVWFDVTALGVMDEVGVKTIKIQRSSDKINWGNVRTFTKDVNTGLICKNSGGHVGYVSYTGTAGYYYRAYVVFYAKNSSGTGQYMMYTSTIQV